MTDPKEAKIRQFAKWVEEKEPPTDIAGWIPFAAPIYTLEYFTEPVEPYYRQYRDLEWEHPYHRDGECREPDEEWYTPTPKLLELEARIDALAAKAFRQVPNPDYDPVRAEDYWDTLRQRSTAATIEIGQSYQPILKE